MSNDQNTLLEAEGISAAHVRSFLDVAKQEDCVILTRTPGKACLQLLAEAYDAKGFHIKGKSCSWGPMAGFLCAEPLFNKAGIDGAASNARAHHASLTVDFGREGKSGPEVRSGLVPLEISEARRVWLASDPANVMKLEGGQYRGTTTRDKLQLRWALVPVAGGQRWAVLYEPASLAAASTEVRARLEQVVKAAKEKLGKASAADKDKLSKAAAESEAELATFNRYSASLKEKLVAFASPEELPGYKPVLCLSNPHPPYGADLAHKNAVTGDFDLFAVWPRRGKDAEFRVRVGGMVPGADPKAQKSQIYAAESHDAIGRVAGNISDGLYLIGQLINSAMAEPGRAVQPNRVFHSDEGGRPGMEEVDSSVAFTPAGTVHIFGDKSPEFPKFILQCAANNFVVFLNAGWIAPLGESAKQAGLEKAWSEFVPKIEGQQALRPNAAAK